MNVVNVRQEGAKQLKILIMYRIIKTTTCNEVVYKVQKKFLWWWWFTETLSDIGWHGEMNSPYDMTFDSVKEAEEYVCKAYFKPKIKIIKIIKSN